MKSDLCSNIYLYSWKGWTVFLRIKELSALSELSPSGFSGVSKPNCDLLHVQQPCINLN